MCSQIDAALHIGRHCEKPLGTALFALAIQPVVQAALLAPALPCTCPHDLWMMAVLPVVRPLRRLRTHPLLGASRDIGVEVNSSTCCVVPCVCVRVFWGWGDRPPCTTWTCSMQAPLGREHTLKGAAQFRKRVHSSIAESVRAEDGGQPRARNCRAFTPFFALCASVIVVYRRVRVP